MLIYYVAPVFDYLEPENHDACILITNKDRIHELKNINKSIYQ